MGVLRVFAVGRAMPCMEHPRAAQLGGTLGAGRQGASQCAYQTHVPSDSAAKISGAEL